MALTENMGNGYAPSVADIAAVVQQPHGYGMPYYAGNFGNNGFMDGNNAWWIILLVLLLGGNNGWGNGFGGGNAIPYLMNNNTNNDVQRGFDQQSVMTALGNLNTVATNGFANAEVSRCNAQTNLLQSMNSLAMGLQNCCCQQQASTADLKYTVATEACADRNAVEMANRDLQVMMTNQTNAILQNQNAGFQGLQDKLCQLELDYYKQQVTNLTADNATLRANAERTAQTATILANNDAQTASLIRQLNPTAVPAYIVANPNGCGCNNGCYSCG